jgi:hypothetical protein
MLKRLAAIGLGLLVAGPFCFQPIDETDIGWHLALGRLIAKSGMPFRNALSWTAPDQPWYPTSWLFDWVTFRAMETGGPLGLQLTMFVFLALTIVGVALAGERIDRQLGVWMAPIVGLLLTARITERPHVATWAILAWVLYLCLPTPEQRALRGADRDEATWRRRLLAVPLIALGSNLHSGAAFAAIVLGLFCLETFLLGTRRRRELVLAAVGVAALAANPGGLFNITYILQHLHVRDVISLDEFLPPTFAREAVFFFLVPLTLVLAWRLRRDSPALLVTLAVFAVLGFRAVRMVFDFQIIAAVALALAFAWLRERWSAQVAGGAIAVVVLALVVWRVQWFAAVRFVPAFDEQAMPVRAAQFIREQGLDGRLFNAFTDGGYLEWALPDVPAFQDGRVQAWPPEFFLREQQADEKPETFRAWLRELNVEWAVTRHRDSRMSGYRQLEAPDWALVYWDEASQIYLRRDVPRLQPIIEKFEYRRFRPFSNIIAGMNTARRAELIPWLAELDHFQRFAPRLPEAWLVRCGVLKRLGSEEAGAACTHATEVVTSSQGKQLLALINTLTATAE